MVNHATNSETAKVTVAPYQVSMVNHAMMNKMAKITDTVHLACVVNTINNTDEDR